MYMINIPFVSYNSAYQPAPTASAAATANQQAFLPNSEASFSSPYMTQEMNNLGYVWDAHFVMPIVLLDQMRPELPPMSTPQFRSAPSPIFTLNRCATTCQTGMRVATQVLAPDQPSSIVTSDYQDMFDQLRQASLTQSLNVQPLVEVEHRFTDIECPKETAVRVGDSYIHANYVGVGISDKLLVAAQLPTPSSQETFWKFVMDSDCSIMDLTKPSDCSENDRYYPDSIHTSHVAGSIQIEFLETCSSEKDSHTTYQVTSGTTSKKIVRYHYRGWMDFGGIQLEELGNLTAKLKSFSGVVVHCRAGVGRTGTIISAYLIKELIEQKVITKENYRTEIPNLILSLRKQRGKNFVTSVDQFSSLMEYGKKLLEDRP